MGTFAGMFRAISASIIYPVSTVPLLNGVLILDDAGVIISVLSAEEAELQGVDHIEFFEGALIPGLVNTHCHLELSHLLHQIPEHTGLPVFLEKVINYPKTEDGLVLEAIKQADLAMYLNGIVAVGDISNKLISKIVKLDSKIHYHTFVEILGFNPQNAASIMKRGEELKNAFEPLSASVTPHAPYSVSKELFAEIKRYSANTDNLHSMHNQETSDENLFYEKKEGAFLKFYAALGLDIGFFTAGGKSSLQTVLPELPEGKVLLVHNTLTNAADVKFAADAPQDLFWCLCPNANLYIENRLPPVKMMQEAGLKITLGTDSLASNHQLSILAEMFTLQENLATSDHSFEQGSKGSFEETSDSSFEQTPIDGLEQTLRSDFKETAVGSSEKSSYDRIEKISENSLEKIRHVSPLKASANNLEETSARNMTSEKLQPPIIDFEDLLRWGTLNGAEFLGIDQQYGSFEPGKKPGINLIQGMDGQKLTASVTIKRLI